MKQANPAFGLAPRRRLGMALLITGEMGGFAMLLAGFVVQQLR